jgi:hypothetical protein
MNPNTQISTKEEARQFAIDWANWITEDTQNPSYGELTVWTEFFTELAEEFDLQEEFKENGIL